MNRYEAHAKARRLWGGPLRLPRAVIRRKTEAQRFIVGYMEDGVMHFMGRGASLEETFADAERAGGKL